jgi:hypothetical protein
MKTELIISIVSVLFGLASLVLAILFYRISTRLTRKENEILKKEIKQLSKYEVLYSLDEWAEETLKCAIETKHELCLSLPFPLLFSFYYNEDFTYDNYRESVWYKKFCQPFISNISRNENEKINLRLIRLNDSRSYSYARQYFECDEKAKSYMKILTEFEGEIKGLVKNFIKEPIFDIPHWMAISDYDLRKEQEAVVAFSNPDLVLDKRSKEYLSNREIGNQLKGIIAKDNHAVEYFHKNFNYIIQRQYFVEVFAEIENKLSKYFENNIEIAYIHKFDKLKESLSKDITAPEGFTPSEVIFRKIISNE